MPRSGLWIYSPKTGSSPRPFRMESPMLFRPSPSNHFLRNSPCHSLISRPKPSSSITRTCTLERPAQHTNPLPTNAQHMGRLQPWFFHFPIENPTNYTTPYLPSIDNTTHPTPHLLYSPLGPALLSFTLTHYSLLELFPLEGLEEQ